MAGKQQHEYPPDEEIIAGVAQHGSITAYARALGVPVPTLNAYIGKRGLRPRLDVTRRKYLAAPPRVGEQVSREEVLEQENAQLRQAVAKARSEDVKEERVIAAITDALTTATPRYKAAARPRHKKEAHEFVLLWSDVHAAEVVSREETNGANEYDWQIMLDRHQQLLRGVLSYQEHRPYPVSRLHILALGDQLSGNIHDELAETNEMPLAEATVQLGLDAADWLAEFVPHFSEIRFSGVVGNHPRAHGKPRAKQRYDNADWTCYQVMRQRLARYPSLHWEIPKPQQHLVQICDRRLLMLHGDGIRSTMVDVPWGGIIRQVAKLQNQYASMGAPIDHFVMGHYHEANMVKAGRIVMNGSVKGVDEYAIQRFGGGQPPQQVLLTFHPSRGLTDVSLIDLA